MVERPKLGTGISFKMHHLASIQSDQFPIDWLELLTETFLVPTKKISSVLEQLKRRFPLVLHGVGLGIGSAEPLDFDYLSKVKRLANEIDAPWISDHISWGQAPGAHLHELLPLPYTREVADYVIERARVVQDFLERPFALENISSYALVKKGEMKEWEFCSYVIEASQTHMILDVNNIYVVARNLGYDAQEYMNGLPWDRILEIHLAGHSDMGEWIFDTHDCAITKEVWELYRQAWARSGHPATLIEYDGLSQSFDEIAKEVAKAREIQQEALHACTLCPT